MLELKVMYKSRIDKYISNNTDISRNDIKELIASHAVFSNGISVRKPNFEVKENDTILITSIINKEIKASPVKMDLNIIFENDDFIIIDKPTNLVVHPAPGNMDNTLVNGLVYHFKNNLSSINGELRPGIVHRIDKDTSGLLVIAKNNKMHQHLANQIKNHEVKRKYKAIVEGRVNNKAINIDLPIGRDPKHRQKMAVIKQNAKEAFTKIILEKNFQINNKDFSLVDCELKTGRTHQIRVHLSYIKFPVYGDPLYGTKVDDFNQRLHAYELSFKDLNGKTVTFVSSLPKEMEEMIKEK